MNNQNDNSYQISIRKYFDYLSDSFQSNNNNIFFYFSTHKKNYSISIYT